MPALGAAVATLVTSTTVAAVIGKMIITMAFSALVSKLTAKKPPSPIVPAIMINVREPIPPRRIIMGERRVGGVMLFMDSTDAGQGQTLTYDAVIPPSPYKIRLPDDRLRAVWLVKLRMSADPYDDVTMTQVVGTPGAGEYELTNGLFTFSEEDRGRNVQIRYSNLTDVTAPDKVLHIILVLAAHEVESIDEIYFNDAVVPLASNGEVTSGRYEGWAIVRKHLGAPDQTAEQMLVSRSLGRWTHDHRIRGHAYLYVQLIARSTIFPNGVPTITAVVKGKKDIYDPRTGAFGYTDNVALCTANYICDQKYGMRAIYEEEIIEDELIASANVCDEGVLLSNGGTEKRYALSAVIECNQPHEEVIARLRDAMAGIVLPSGPGWIIAAGAYRTPTVELDENDMMGDLEILPAPSVRDTFNAVKGIYISPQWQPTDYSKVTNSAYEDEDGERIFGDLDLPYTNSHRRARRIARIRLEQQRNALTVRMPCGLQGLKLRAGSTVMLSHARFGWPQKVFEVMNWEFTVKASDGDGDGDALVLGTALVLRETGAAVYDWSPGDDRDDDVTPNTDLDSPWNVATPGMQAPVEVLYETREGRGVGVKVILQCSYVSGAESYQFEYKLAADDVFTRLPLVPLPVFEITDVAAGIYDFRVRAVTSLGVPSLFAQIRHEVRGLSGTPADIQNATGQAMSGLFVLQWQQSTDLDVRRGGKIHVRHTEAMSGAVWEESYSVIDPLPGDYSTAIVPLKAGTYLLRAQDSSGNFSANSATVSTKDASVLTYSIIDSVQEDPTFPGAKDGVVLDGSVLKLVGGGMFDSIPDFDAVANLDAFGGFLGTGTYYMTGIDLGSVQKVRLFTELAMEVVQASALFDSRTEPMDDWADFDGAAGGAAGDAAIHVRETDDDPGGTPTWSAWSRLTTGEKEARAFELILIITCSNQDFNVQVSKARVHAKEIA